MQANEEEDESTAAVDQAVQSEWCYYVQTARQYSVNKLRMQNIFDKVSHASLEWLRCQIASHPHLQPLSLHLVRVLLQEGKTEEAILERLLFGDEVDGSENKKGKAIKNVHLSGQPWGGDISVKRDDLGYCFAPLLKVLSKNTTVVSLQISRMSLRGCATGRLLGQAASHVGELRLMDCLLDESFVMAMAAAATRSPPKLSLQQCGDLAVSLLESLAECKEHWKGMEYLGLAHNNASLTSHSLPALTVLLSAQTESLRELQLGPNEYLLATAQPDPGMGNDLPSSLQLPPPAHYLEDFCHVLQSLNHLESLDLSSCRMELSTVLQLLAHLSASCHELCLNQALRLDDDDISADEMVPFLEWVATNDTVLALDLRCCRVGNAVVVPLFEALERNQTVQSLSLAYNHFDICGWEARLPRLTALRSLECSLYETDAWSRLQPYLHQNTSLTHVATGITDLDRQAQATTSRNHRWHQAKAALCSPQCVHGPVLWPRIVTRLFRSASGHFREDANATAVYAFLKEAMR